MSAPRNRVHVLLLPMMLSLFVFIAACAQTATPTRTPEGTVTEDNMENTDDSMARDSADAMEKDGDAMPKDTIEKTDDSMSKDSADAMEKDGDAMAKDTTEKTDDAMAKDSADAMAKDTTEKTDDAMAKDTMENADDSMAEDSADAMKQALPDKIVAPHFVDSYPAHGDSLVQTPEVVVLNFNFNLHPNSGVALSRNGELVSLEAVTISADELTLRATLQEDGGDGVYHLRYSACWPDGSCHDGSIAFVVDSNAEDQYLDLRGQVAVTNHMKDGVRFASPRIIVSPGTTVTWINDDLVVHFVNSDPHPAHNVLSDLNSTAIGPGESYSYTFSEPGAWGYHCSAHHNLGMIAQIVVK